MNMFFISLSISISIVFSLPSYSIEENSGCINCHVNPTGGGMRNDYGSNIYSLDELSIRKWIKSDDKKFDGFIKDNVQIGGDFRIQSYDRQQNHTIFPMQIDLYSNIEFKNNFSMFMKYGAEFELYFLLNKKNRWIKLGKTMPNYGLKLDDHTSFIRGGNSSNSYIYSGSVDEGLIFDYASTYKDPVLVEVGSKINKNISFTSSISTGIVGEDEENITLSVFYINKMNFGSIFLGTSIMQENEFRMLGMFGGFSKGNLTLTYEVDKVNNWIIDYESLASYLEMVYKPIQGVHMIAKYDFFDKNYDLLDGSVGRYSFGFNFFPSNLIEIKLQLRDYKLYSIDFDTDREYLVQLHTWF